MNMTSNSGSIKLQDLATSNEVYSLSPVSIQTLIPGLSNGYLLFEDHAEFMVHHPVVNLISRLHQ